MISWFIEFLESSPPGEWVLPLLGLISMVETAFPPFPGDVIFIITAGWARIGGAPAGAIIAAGFFGCMISSVGLYLFGKTVGRGFTERFVVGWLAEERVRRAERLFARHGKFILALSRFIPGIRSLLVVVAGASRMSGAAVLLPVSFSAAVWYALLSIGGILAGDNVGAAKSFLHRYERWIWLVVGVAVAAYLIIVAVRNLSRRRS